MLACPACPRTLFKGDYKITDLPVTAVSEIAQLQQSYDWIYLCGNHGDPIYHPQFHEILHVLTTQFRGSPPLYISTNGSYRDEAWWTETARILRPTDQVIFGIDGLALTSKLYRKNSDWDSATQGMRLLKQLGRARVAWQWILFNFNEDQLKDARRLSDEWGIDEFLIVRSFRNPTTNSDEPTISIEEAYARFNA